MKLTDAAWIAPLLVQVAEGKTLQTGWNGDWTDWDGDEAVEFDAPASFYRIKPEPRTLHVVRGTSGGVVTATEDKKLATTLQKAYPGRTVTEYVEKL